MKQYIKILQSARFYEFLYKIDRDLANTVHRQQTCPHCGGKLDRANYFRKPRGPQISNRLHCLAFSFSCRTDGCRKRFLPPSVRFLGRFVYLSHWIALISYFLAKSGYKHKDLSVKLSISSQTLKRWEVLWDNIFSDSSALSKLIRERYPSARSLKDLADLLLNPSSLEKSIIYFLKLFRHFSFYFNGGVIYANDSS